MSCAYCHQYGFGSGVGKTNLIDARHSLGEEFRELEFGFRWRADRHQLSGLRDDCRCDCLISVTVDQRRPVVHEVDALHAVDIHDTAAVTRRLVDRIRCKMDAMSRISTREHACCAFVKAG
ncbi:MAG: hypothetical protein OES10_14000 [Gammaproteobacteria bacterium]|nr:hypothetical protein [Gammaproteobacteria bacterium]